MMDVATGRTPFIVLEGMDGSGKTTHQARLAEWLRQQGFLVTCCRDPGDTWLGNQLRELLLHSELPLQPITEALLFMAARAELLAQIIRPALNQGQWVVCDRFLLSTIVYQGYAGGVRPELLRSLGEAAAEGTLPDLTLVLDLPVEVAATRLKLARHDRFEARGPAFQRRVREGFLHESRREGHRIRVVDAAGSIDEVQQRIRHEVRCVLENHFRS